MIHHERNALAASSLLSTSESLNGCGIFCVQNAAFGYCNLRIWRGEFKQAGLELLWNWIGFMSMEAFTPLNTTVIPVTKLSMHLTQKLQWFVFVDVGQG